MYAKVTNTYTTALTLLPGAYLELISPSTDVDFYLVSGSPTYGGSPSFTPYTCTEVPPAPPTGSCITLQPGDTRTIAFAANATSGNIGWEWGSSTSSWFTTAAGTTIQIILDYSFQGSHGYEVHALNLPFQGVYIG
jgi:hypothetical protein